MKKKICMLAVAHSAKDDRIFFKESLSLHNAGFEVINLIGTNPNGQILDMSGEVLNPNGEKEVFLEGIKTIGIAEEKGKTQSLLKKVFRGKYYQRFIQKGVEENAAVYHAHEPQSYWLALQIAKQNGAKVVFDAHESWRTGSPKDMLIKRRQLRHLKYLIAANPLTVSHLKKFNPKIQSEVIYNASIIGQQAFNESQEIVIVHEGSFPFNRGLKLMLTALKILKEKKLRFTLKIIGEFRGEEKIYFDEFVRHHSLDAFIQVTGWKKYEEMPAELKGASIGLILNTPTPNNIYGGPANKLFNYIANNLCVIAVDLPETKRIVEKYNCGTILNNRSPELLADTLIHYFQNKADLNTKRKAAYEAHKELSWKNEADKLIAFYHNSVLA
ncbi:MAG: glycosyltransferase [Bacteroidota bacterium]